MPAIPPLLCHAEQLLFGRLVRAFPGHVVLAQVALSRLIGAGAPGATPSLVAGFVVCKADFTAMAVVEFGSVIGSGTGPGPDDAARRDEMLQAAGIKVIRVVPGDLPSEAALRALAAMLPLAPARPPVMRHAS